MSIKLSIIEDEVSKLADQVADGHGVEVAGLNLFAGKNRKLLRVTIDKEGGVTLDDCERFSRELEALIEADELLEGPYTLEVSSPGLDRPLTKPKDFERNIGRLIKIMTRDKIEGRNSLTGRIIGIFDSFVKLAVDKRVLDVPLETIIKAKLEIEIK